MVHFDPPSLRPSSCLLPEKSTINGLPDPIGLLIHGHRRNDQCESFYTRTGMPIFYVENGSVLRTKQSPYFGVAIFRHRRLQLLRDYCFFLLNHFAKLLDSSWVAISSRFCLIVTNRNDCLHVSPTKRRFLAIAKSICWICEQCGSSCWDGPHCGRFQQITLCIC